MKNKNKKLLTALYFINKTVNHDLSLNENIVLKFLFDKHKP